MTSNKKIMLASLVAILIVSTTVFASIQTAQKEAYGQTPTILYPSRERTIYATGSATESVVPDLVIVQFGMDTQATTAKEAIDSNTKAMNAVISAIENIGITKDEISTAGFSISPVYNDTVPYPYGIHRAVLVGYQASNTLYVKTTKITSAGTIIDTAVGAGANRVDNVSFTLSSAKQQSVQDDLLSQSVQNAQSRAEKALEPLGQKIIGVKTVSLSDTNVQPPPVYYAAKADSSTPIFASNQEVTTSVSVTFLIDDK